MNKRVSILIRSVAFAASVAALAAFAPGSSRAEEEHTQPPRVNWSFAGGLGAFDPAQLQRGYKVYREVCSNCHSMKLLAFRNLADAGGPGFTAGQVQSLAAQYQIKDGPNDQGEMFERPGRASDHFPWAFANAEAARVANGGALPPDMSVLAKARGYERGFPWFIIDALPFVAYQEKGPDYINAILNGYPEKPPKEFDLPAGMYYNKYMPGHKIAMPKPLSDGQVDFDDKSPNDVQSMSRDVSAFLMWAAEPQLVNRKQTGLRVLAFLIVFATLLYFVKKRIWANVHADALPGPAF